MEPLVLHAGFDGLKFTLQAEIGSALRDDLASAKAQARAQGSEVAVTSGDVTLSVRPAGGSGFVAHTGDLGAIWLFQDPQNRIPHNPGITVDFRAYGLATGGIEAAEDHFRRVMEALDIRYADHQLRLTRADYAVDILAPWFEPDRNALVLPPGTKLTEYTGAEDTPTQATGSRVTGIRAGEVGNRQLAIYDKRLEVMTQGKAGWPPIWNAALAHLGLEPLDLSNRDQSQVWRFDIRLGSKQLRNRFEIMSWHDLRTSIGDAFSDAHKRIRYTTPTRDSNRSRWPEHELWQVFVSTVEANMDKHFCGVLPSDVICANRIAKMRELDRMILGLFITRAAVSGVIQDEFYTFMDQHTAALQRASEEHDRPLQERLGKTAARYRWMNQLQD